MIRPPLRRISALPLNSAYAATPEDRSGSMSAPPEDHAEKMDAPSVLFPLTTGIIVGLVAGWAKRIASGNRFK